MKGEKVRLHIQPQFPILTQSFVADFQSLQMRLVVSYHYHYHGLHDESEVDIVSVACIVTTNVVLHVIKVKRFRFCLVK